MGQVSFEGPLRDAYTACMWSRMASTIVAVIEQAPISGPEDLYQVASAIPWEEHLAPSSTFAVFPPVNRRGSTTPVMCPSV